ncbi:MAG TPA: OsmC family protein [Chitinophagaceae bacterium]|jgi:putative redox protein|nr:OsmC family protein [Chitinophagaceae bacterium]
MIKTITRWKKDHEFEAEHHGNKIKIDGAGKNGHGPKALLLSALAGCSGIDVVDILHKMRVSFSSLEIEVETTQTEEPPKVYKDILIIYKIKTNTHNEEKVIKAIDLSLEKYCGVSAMLKKNSAISYKLVIES